MSGYYDKRAADEAQRTRQRYIAAGIISFNPPSFLHLRLQPLTAAELGKRGFYDAAIAVAQGKREYW